jgi:hypothetical protein
VFNADSQACAPRYAKAVLEKLRRDDALDNPRADLFAQQTDIDAQARVEAIYWIVSQIAVHGLTSKVVFLALKILDRMIAAQGIERPRLKFYAVGSLSLAGKIESQSGARFKGGTDQEDGEVRVAELEIMETLMWRISTTTIVLYLKMYVNAVAGDIELSLTAIFVGLCSLLSPDLAIEDSEILAISVMAVALDARGRPAQPAELQDVFSRFGTEKIQLVVQQVTQTVQAVITDQNSPIRAIFSVPERAAVALLPFHCPTLH